MAYLQFETNCLRLTAHNSVCTIRMFFERQMQSLDECFSGFIARRIDGGAGPIFTRIGGQGAPVLLLHGYPETHAMWHKIAPELAKTNTVVVADLRGYGRSFAPASSPNGVAMAKREMAADMVAVMAALGLYEFSVIGHDRGARVAYRLALDHPGKVTRLALLDIITTYDIWHTLDVSNAMRMWHWTFLAQSRPFPERWISSDPMGWVEERFRRGGRTMPPWLSEVVLDDYRQAFAEPKRLSASCDDYRAGAGIDLEHDTEDLAIGRQILCPTRVLWGARGNLVDQRDPLALWRKWVKGPLSGRSLDSGHFIPEENPDQLLPELRAFLSQG
jgi:haloacetate dehalogenase